MFDKLRISIPAIGPANHAPMRGDMTLRNFDLNLLSHLDALLSERNVTRAADRMCVTQSTMSGVLRRLRDRFNDELLVRNGRQFDLTPLAQSLGQAVRQTLLQIEQTISTRPVFAPETDRRRFRIMASDYCVTVLLSLVLRQIACRAPHLGFDFNQVAAPLEAVREGQFDMCITGHPAVYADATDDPLLHIDPLFPETYVCVVDRSHPIGARIGLDEFFAYPHVVTKLPNLFMTTDLLESLSGAQPRQPLIRVPGFSQVAPLVTGTRAIGVIPRRLLGTLPADSGLRAVETEFEMPGFCEHLIWHGRYASDPAFQWFRAEILTAAATLQPAGC